MKLKLDESGAVILTDGKPVYMDDAGKEHTYDAPAMRATLDKLGPELNTQRARAEKLEADAKAFEGLDVAAARKALETVGNLDQSKLIDADKVEEIRQAAIKSVEEKYAPIEQRANELESQIIEGKIGAEFNGSEFITKGTRYLPEFMQATFRKHFEVKEGRVVAKDSNGNLIYSDKNPGETASFDEAMEKIVGGHRDRDKILLGANQNGSGANGVDEGGTGRTFTRAQEAEMNPTQKTKLAKDLREGNAQLVD